MINICSATKLIKNEKLFSDVLNSGFTHLRINFSHINSEQADIILETAKRTCNEIKIIQDLQGPKIRVGDINKIYNDKLCVVNKYCKFILYKEGEEIKDTFLPKIPICFEDYELLRDTKKFILYNRNTMATISILGFEEYPWGSAFVCMSDADCIFRTEKGLNAIGFDRMKTTLSEKDKRDVLWGLENKADVLILSFVSSREHIIEFKKYIKEQSDYMPKIWAKIECLDGILNAEEIIKECDGIMIGRGDLSIEIPVIDIPKFQNDLILLCKREYKECIVATHLFDNYENAPDLSDITAIHYLKEVGATGFMMSNEVIFAKNPVKISNDFIDILKGGNKMMTKVTKKNFKEEIEGEKKPVLLVFSSKWCSPCQKMDAVLREIEEERQDLKICKVHVEDDSDLAIEHNIMSVPTALLIEDNKVISKFIGYKSKSNMLKLIDKKKK